MSSPDAADHQDARAPWALYAAAWWWLFTALVSLIDGLISVASLAASVKDTSPTAAAASGVTPGQSEALLTMLVVISAVVDVAFVVLPLAYAFSLRWPHQPGRRARAVLTAMAVVGILGTVLGYYSADIDPFTAGKSVHNLLTELLDLLWIVAALAATTTTFTPSARNYLQRDRLT